MLLSISTGKSFFRDCIPSQDYVNARTDTNRYDCVNKQIGWNANLTIFPRYLGVKKIKKINRFNLTNIRWMDGQFNYFPTMFRGQKKNRFNLTNIHATIISFTNVKRTH